METTTTTSNHNVVHIIDHNLNSVGKHNVNFHNNPDDDEGGNTGLNPLSIFSDMDAGQRSEIREIAAALGEKYQPNSPGQMPKYNEVARELKEALDKKYAPEWQVICGEAFGFQVTYELGSFMYMYMLGNVALLAWKCE